MYNSRPNLMLGFHGCDENIRNGLVTNPNSVKMSNESYDWLGHGFYVWENNYERALLWAKDKKKRGGVSKPSVLGVVYQLNYCFDLTDSTFLNILPTYYNLLKEDFLLLNKELPTNKDLPKDEHRDLILRELDCTVIEHMHQKIEEGISTEVADKGYSNLTRFDTVRGVFTEGGPVFDGAGIQSKNHIQICIRNPNCIKGFFIPRQETSFP